MKIATKVGLTLATAAMSIGLLGSPATALADTSWGCPGCVSSNK
jgi:hypothetical protein